MRKITAMDVRTIKKPGRYLADDTLYLYVQPSGGRQWVQRVRINRRRVDIGLEGYPIVTLAEAREVALDNRRFIRKGGIPLAVRRRANVPTFREAAESYHGSGKASRKNDQHSLSWMQYKTYLP